MQFSLIESLLVTALPVLFLIVLFGGGALFRRREIDMDGTPPIDKRIYLPAKYSIVVLWAATAARSWGAGISPVRVPEPSRWIALALWVFGFGLLFAGRIGLGASFRIGSPLEKTGLRTSGLFRFSRNPMYLGIYSTVLASFLYTLNPIVLALAIFVVAVHHRIVVAEERYLSGAFGDEYADYCCRVRRYI